MSKMATWMLPICLAEIKAEPPVWNVTIEDRTDPVTNIAAQLGIGQNAVQDIISTLGNQEVCCHWAPHLLRNETKGHV
jgi:hypothetical protein